MCNCGSGTTARSTLAQTKLHGARSQVLGKAAKDTGDLLDAGGTKKLKATVKDRLGDGYTTLAEFQRGEMLLFLFARRDVAKACEVLDLGAENAGLGGIGANKGGISVRIRAGTTTLAFSAMHLAAHEGRSNYEARNANVEEILHGTSEWRSRGRRRRPRPRDGPLARRVRFRQAAVTVSPPRTDVANASFSLSYALAVRGPDGARQPLFCAGRPQLPVQPP